MLTMCVQNRHAGCGLRDVGGWRRGGWRRASTWVASWRAVRRRRGQSSSRAAGSDWCTRSSRPSARGTSSAPTRGSLAMSSALAQRAPARMTSPATRGVAGSTRPHRSGPTRGWRRCGSARGRTTTPPSSCGRPATDRRLGTPPRRRPPAILH